MHTVYLVNLKFEDRHSIEASADIHIAIHRYVYQLMGVFCDRLKLCSTAALDCQTGQNKGRYLVKISLPDDIIAKAVAKV